MLKNYFSFLNRHIGSNENEQSEMLSEIGEYSLDTLIQNTLPNHIIHNNLIGLSEGKSEIVATKELKKIAIKNKLFKNFIGQGYYNTITPPVILRNILENPGWYTQYTPYQAEISQGRLEALINFQTMVCDLTGMEISNASLLDEATAAAEAITLIQRNQKNNDERNIFFVDENCFEQTKEVIKTRLEYTSINLVIGSVDDLSDFESCFGVLLQYPNKNGELIDYSEFINKLKKHQIKIVFATDLLALTLIKTPADFFADVVVGTTQRFGVPLGFGGPHAAFLATKDEYKRQMPGRIIGVSKDVHGNPAYRMSLQTREQHIRKDKATSNICTAQALLAIVASMYAVYHGKDGLKAIAQKVHSYSVLLKNEIEKLGFKQQNFYFFDTLRFELATQEEVNQLRKIAENYEINFYYKDKTVQISVDETSSHVDINKIVKIFSEFKNSEISLQIKYEIKNEIPKHLTRSTDFLTHEVFNQYHSETKMLRYLKRLENKDLSLTLAMIPLGSCTMKLNATSEMLAISWKEFSQLHPFAPLNQAEGYLELFGELEDYLCKITGFDACSLQPNSGAQGEYAGLLAIKNYFKSKKDNDRTIVLIPSSAHGTNPATASMLGFKIITVSCDEKGNVNVEDLKNKVKEFNKNIAALMITYPSTHGVFEEQIVEICQTIHQVGGQVYMDGANMNAQVGLTSPGYIGADVCHLNLHKTFAIPHGGGGPGMGPICVKKHLEDFLPGHSIHPINGRKNYAVSAAPWGSASVLTISHAYIKMLGEEGVTQSTKIAILHANYIKARLEKYYPILYQGINKRVAHELIIDVNIFKKEVGIEVDDIAKRLIDYGFHAPTMSFPVAGTLMIEPTESEDKKELDRFCEAMISIRKEIEAIKNGDLDKEDNPLKNAPHTSKYLLSDSWNHKYSRELAAYPMENENFKYWSPVGRIDNTYGDKNLFCSCIPVE